MSYRCNCCGAEFDEPFGEPAGAFMGNLMVHYVCPECGEDDFIELEEDDE